MVKFWYNNFLKGNIIMKNLKKALILTISLLLVFSTLFSCSSTPSGNDNDVSTEITTSQPEETTEAFVDIAPYGVKESYLPEDIAQQMKEMYTGRKAKYTAYSAADAPYIPSATNIFTNCTLESISLPIVRTGKADADGNLIFTIFVYKNNFAGFKAKPIRSYEIKIKPEDYGLSAGKNYLTDYIDIDLTSYGIKLSEEETIGFFAKDDTLYPAYLANNEDNANKALALLREEFPRANGCYIKAGSADFTYSQSSLVFDLKWEREYEKLSVYNEIMGADARYEEMVKALKEKYEGKYVSVVGDSI